MQETLSPIAQTAEPIIFEQQYRNHVSPISSEFSFGKALVEELNKWQKVATATHDVVTPANALDTVAFVGSMYGINHLDSWKGILVTGASFMADVVDGKIARATGTQSALGEAIDAGGDKIKLAYALYKFWQLDLVPKPLIITIAAQNGLNVALTALDRSTNEIPLLHPSKFGKKAIFLQQWGLGLHVMGSEVSKTNENRGKAIKLAGTLLGAAGVVVGGVATAGYIDVLRKNRH